MGVYFGLAQRQLAVILSYSVQVRDGPLYTIGSSSAYLPTATYLYCSRTTLRSFAQTSSIRCRALQCPNVFGKIGAFGYLMRATQVAKAYLNPANEIGGCV